MEGTDETEQERKIRIADEAAQKKWSWFGYLYTLAKGDITKMESIAKLNFIFSLTYKSYELENKAISEYYDYKRFNIRGQ